jgi:hypothetical protein
VYVGAPRLANAADPALRRLAELADRLHLPRVSRLTLSVIYNGAYYQGMAEQLGGRTGFRDAILRRRARAGRPTGPEVV